MLPRSARDGEGTHRQTPKMTQQTATNQLQMLMAPLTVDDGHRCCNFRSGSFFRLPLARIQRAALTSLFNTSWRIEVLTQCCENIKNLIARQTALCKSMLKQILYEEHYTSTHYHYYYYYCWPLYRTHSIPCYYVSS